MNFDNKFIKESDLEFFNSLPEDERLLLMYDLLFDDDLIPAKEQLEEVTRLDDKEIASVLALDGVLIINGTSEFAISSLVQEFFYDGIVLMKFKKATPALTKKFKYMKHFVIYRILGTANFIYDN